MYIAERKKCREGVVKTLSLYFPERKLCAVNASCASGKHTDEFLVEYPAETVCMDTQIEYGYCIESVYALNPLNNLNNVVQVRSFKM